MVPAINYYPMVHLKVYFSRALVSCDGRKDVSNWLGEFPKCQLAMNSLLSSDGDLSRNPSPNLRYLKQAYRMFDQS
jgi:hypothetical protein